MAPAVELYPYLHWVSTLGGVKGTGAALTCAAGYVANGFASDGTLNCISVLIAYGTIALPPNTYAPGTCTLLTAVATGVDPSSNPPPIITAGFSADPTSTTGYLLGQNGIPVLLPSLTLNTAKFELCNYTSLPIVIGSGLSLNWRVPR
jgi:hypothetical protein